MPAQIFVFALVGLLGCQLLLAVEPEETPPIAWTAIDVDPKFRSEGVAVSDFNRDGKQDITVGDLWYEAPDWRPHEIRPAGDYADGKNTYSKAFLCFVDDVNRDTWPDVIVIGFPGHVPCYWYENPQGKERHWAEHLLHPASFNESPQLVDLFGDGHKVLVMGEVQKGQMAWFEPVTDPTQPWQVHPISSEVPMEWIHCHGLGTGDLNGDGRLDVLVTHGWWEQPASRDTAWTFHETPLGDPCGKMCVLDLSGDGLADVITSSAHGYGIWGFIQSKDNNGKSTFSKVDFFPHLCSQTHALESRDLDGDGILDLVTGKRWWAHGPSGDPGSNEPAVLYWFQGLKSADGGIRFVPRKIHDSSGVGTQFELADVNGDGRADIVTSNKKGVHLFLQAKP